MPADMEEGKGGRPDLGFVVLNQKVDLDVDFASRFVKGKTEITILPLVKDLTEIRLDCRQLKPTRATVDGKTASVAYSDLYRRLQLYLTTGIYQHHFPKNRISAHKTGNTNELVVYLPPTVKPQVVRDGAADIGMVTRNTDMAVEGAMADTLEFAIMTVVIDYNIDEFRDGVQFIGAGNGEANYPHLFTRNSPYPGTASCVVPCVDDSMTRCTWDFSIRCPRTLGDATRKPRPAITEHDRIPLTNGNKTTYKAPKVDSVTGFESDDELMSFDEEEMALEMAVICSGDLTDEIVDSQYSGWKTATFNCSVPVLPQHIGFAIGPFEHVDLSEYRDSEVDERLGSNASRIHAFCLPGRSEDVQNSAMMLAGAADFFTERFLAYPFTSYKLCFVDDLASDVTIAASMSICSTRLLYPQDIQEPIESVTRSLVYALASQWIGVYVVPATPQDWWIIVGGAWFMTDFYLRDLMGKNDYKYRQKLMADRVVAMDIRRPSIFDLGPHLPLDPGEMEFMELKAPLVLSILHHRLVKQSGKNGVDRCFWRMLLNAKAGNLPNSAISTEEFHRICEKVGHQRLELFFKQWVEGGGCPAFQCSARFNKKKMMVEMTIDQVQGTSLGNFGDEQVVLEPSNFMREVKEHTQQVYAAPTQHHFTGPMTIRIHEADGTPYEHIVDITSRKTKLEIPYNTKYKRLKRSRRQKERAAAQNGVDITGEAQDDVLLYCLGDVLQGESEVKEWGLFDWSKEDEDKMSQESYEWFRIDADFEWICKTSVNMPSYMYVSQLQQDKDIVAQLESVQWLASKPGHELLSSILVRTLMDERYFHGIRTLAADALANSATEPLHWIGLRHLEKAFKALFYAPGSAMIRPNDFEDRTMYHLQCAIPKAVARIRDTSGKAPLRVKRFIADLLKFNDNTNNPYSDAHYIATLMSCLSQTLTTANGPILADEYDDEDELEFQQMALGELGRLQRVDEWIPSFQNITTITALQCSLDLMQNRVIPRKPMDFMQYTKIGNADNVRLKAWSCLVELGKIKHPAIVKFMLSSIDSDPSPFFRKNLLRIFGYGIGQIALGDVKDDVAAAIDNDVLQIEGDDGPNARKEDHDRKTTVEGAVAALAKEISADQAFQQALEDALRSHSTSLRDVEELLEICGLIFETEDSLPITLKYPRYWEVQHNGKGVMKFRQTEKVRTKPSLKAAKATLKSKDHVIRPPGPKRTLTLTMGNKLAIAAHALEAQAAEPPAPRPKLNLSLSNGNGNDNTTPSASPVIHRAPEVRPPMNRSVSSSQTMPSLPSTNTSPPEPIRASPANRASPALRESPAHRASPAPRASPAQRPTPSQRSSPATVKKARKPKSLIVKLKLRNPAGLDNPVRIKRQSPSPPPETSSGNGNGRKRGNEDLAAEDQRPMKRQASSENMAKAKRPSRIVKLKVGTERLQSLHTRSLHTSHTKMILPFDMANSLVVKQEAAESPDPGDFPHA